MSQINVRKVSDFSFAGSDTLRVAVQLGSLRQCTRAFCPRESTSIESTLLLPVEQVRYTYIYASADIVSQNQTIDCFIVS